MIHSTGDSRHRPLSEAIHALGAAVARFPRLYLQLFLNGFCRYLPLPILVLLLVGFASGLIGEGMGIQFLFFHYEPWKGFAAGFFFALVFACILLVGYFLWLRDSTHEFAGGNEPLHAAHSLIGFAKYAGVVSVGFILSVALLAVSFELISLAARSHLLSSASPESKSGETEHVLNPAAFWTGAQLDQAGNRNSSRTTSR